MHRRKLEQAQLPIKGLGSDNDSLGREPAVNNAGLGVEKNQSLGNLPSERETY